MRYDVVIVGAGNAALCAALAALEAGASVAILEKAPKTERGGNSALTVTMRIPTRDFADLEPLLADDVDAKARDRLRDGYRRRDEDFLIAELARATGGKADPELVETYVSRSFETVRWLASKGHRWTPSIDETSLNELMMAGRGRGYQMRNFAYVEAAGADLYYQAAAQALLMSDGRCVGVRCSTPDGEVGFDAGAVVLACGSFEANPEMRAKYLGRSWDAAFIRGVPFNTGDGLRMAIDVGAMPYGSWTTAHASPQDWERPPYGLPSAEVHGVAGGFGWSRYSYPYGILVNAAGRRFVDEAFDVRGMSYAMIGGQILVQPGGRAFQIFDARAKREGLIVDAYDGHGVVADDLPSLASQLGIDVEGLTQTVEAFNAAQRCGTFAPSPVRGDGYRTIGLDIAKSNFATPISEPPFAGYPVRCAVTFAFGGLRIVPQAAQVVHVGGWPIPGLFAAGEMVGGLFYDNYPGGSGMAAGAVFGRIAGASAAEAALS